MGSYVDELEFEEESSSEEEEEVEEGDEEEDEEEGTVDEEEDYVEQTKLCTRHTYSRIAQAHDKKINILGRSNHQHEITTYIHNFDRLPSVSHSYLST